MASIDFKRCYPHLKNLWLGLCIAYPLVILISIAATNIILPFIVLGWFFYRKEINLAGAKTLLYLIAIYLGWTLIAVALSPYSSNWVAWLEERSTFLALLPGLVVGTNQEWLRKSFRFVSIYLLVIALYAVFQYFFGWDVVRGELIRGYLDHYRAIGLQNSPLTFAGMIGIIAPLMVSLNSRVLWRSGLFAVSGTFAVFASMSRTIMLGSFGWGCLLVILGSRKLRITGLILFVALIILPRTIFSAAGERLLKPDETRPFLWQSALNIIQVYPLAGVGEDNWYSAFADYGAEYDLYKTTAHAHNDFLTATVENGIIGGILLVLLWAYITIKTFVAILRTKGPQRDLLIGFLSAFLIILFGGMFQNYQTDAENALLLWFVVGAGVQVGGRDRTPEASYYGDDS